MTDRRPDIHCRKCGQYLYSLSHRADEWKFPRNPRCKNCSTKKAQASKDEAKQTNSSPT